jgi:hypothetical protein
VPISPSLALVPLRGDRRRAPVIRSGGPILGSPSAAFGLLLCLALGWGCAKQAEGERCDLNNGDFDCDTGLLCRGEAQLSLRGNGKGVALCCPSSGETKVDACRATAQLPDEMLPEETPVTPDAGAQTTPEPVLDAGALQPDATPAP